MQVPVVVPGRLLRCLVYLGASGAPQRLEETLDTGTLARSARALTHELDV